MFGNKKTNGTESSYVGGGSIINTLVEGTSLEGVMNTKTDLRIDGMHNGKIFCEGKLIIGPTGRIEGEVSCQNAVIEGFFKGVLKVNDILDVRETANVTGEIKTGKLLVQNGASFNGTCDMGSAISNTYVSADSEVTA